MSRTTDERRIDAHVDALVDEGVLDHDEATDEVWTTDDFERDRHVYYDTYLDVDEEEFHRSVADAFDLPSTEAAADRIDRLDVSREEFATYMALYARLEGYDTGELAEMAGIVVEVGPDSPVPDGVTELDDDSYADFLADHDRAVVTVWKRGCDPCEEMKAELDEILAALPDGAAVGGLDGEQCPDFCRTHEVNAAPAVVFFDDGDRLDVVTGRTSPASLAERVAELYGDG
ncbi:thioredoxin family protein [Halosimplex aquaticum]|uniref:Thioredoxin family protein n=1 Tax=Halosimplex aquaticum TaxID=3026162 RepID=A0ABD5XY77_9EURY|nr:thioredoxin family protein [Halosimplex aquaticum]